MNSEEVESAYGGISLKSPSRWIRTTEAKIMGRFSDLLSLSLPFFIYINVKQFCPEADVRAGVYIRAKAHSYIFADWAKTKFDKKAKSKIAYINF